MTNFSSEKIALMKLLQHRAKPFVVAVDAIGQASATSYRLAHKGASKPK
jgi:hypothetical protein